MKDAGDPGIELRCTCSRRPLLARCGRDPRSGEPWVHVKTWKKDRLYTEVIATGGKVSIHCRDCMRWMSVTIVRGSAALKQEEPEI